MIHLPVSIIICSINKILQWFIRTSSVPLLWCWWSGGVYLHLNISWSWPSTDNILIIPAPESSSAAPSRQLREHDHYICRPATDMWDMHTIQSSSHQIRPDNHLLGETEHSQPSSFQGSIKNISWICNHFLSFKDSRKDFIRHHHLHFLELNLHLNLMRPIFGLWSRSHL